ncbi:MAG: tRNA-dihydrouridine synthase [Phycisphaeraceae bacterium]|nr:tRNA-dihydrouridine synthase [Phycisphaeraceae bacterium]
MLAQPLQIGPVRLATNLLLAPIAGYCDLAFRLAARSWGGVGLACTDLLSPQGLLRGTATSLDLARTNDEDKPVGMQLYGGDANILADGARWAIQHGATVVDINMGCPVDKVTKKDGGSKLLCDPCNTLRLVEKVARAVEQESGGRVPLTAKVRLGWSMGVDVAPSLAPRLVEEGCAAITVHGRYTEQKFKGECHLDGIARVVEAVGARAPVIGNGDVKTPDDCLRMLRVTGCAGVMIGRGALSAPWLFRDCWHAQRVGAGLTGEPAPPEPTEREKLDTIRRYFADMIAFRDERYAMMQIRRRITWFGKRLGPCKPMKERVRVARNPAEVLAALDEFERGGLRWFPRDDGTPCIEDALETDDAECVG